MSTKAYDYFITNLGVFEAADRIRETINPIFFAKFREQLERLGERLRHDANLTWKGASFDSLFVDLPSDTKRILPEYIDDYDKCSKHDSVTTLYRRMEELKNTSMRTLSPLDIFYDALIMRGPEEDTVVFKVFSECQDYTEALSTQDWCSDFSYWNNTDRDESVSEGEWERRKRFYDAAGWTPPSERSVGFTQPCEFVVYTNIDL